MLAHRLEVSCRGGGTVFELAERWLQICREGAEEIATFDDDAALAAQFGDARRDAEQTLAALTATVPDRVLASDAKALQGALKRTATVLASDVLAAKAFAEAIDLQRGAHFLDLAVPEGTVWTFAAGSAVPLVRSPLREAMSGAAMSVREENRGPWTDRSHRMALLPSDSHGMRVDVRRLPNECLVGLKDDFRVGFGALHDDLTAACRWETSGERFFWVEPKDAAAQRHAIEGLLTEADARGAQVLVLPELCHTTREISPSEDTWSWVSSWFNSQHRTALKVLVAGSRHVERWAPGSAEPERRNELLILVEGCAPAVHDKFNPLTFPANKLGAEAQREDIITRPRVITVYADREWSFVPLICKDFLLSEARELMKVLRPSLVLIASMSEKTSDFENDATGLTSACQTVVVYANTPLVLLKDNRTLPTVCLGFVTRPLVDPGQGSAKGRPLERHSVVVSVAQSTTKPQVPCIGLVAGAAKLEAVPVSP